MCGRFSLGASSMTLLDRFNVQESLAWTGRYNIAPTQDVPSVRARPDDGRQFLFVRWGLIPSWAKEPGERMINARAETVTDKPAFRAAFKSRRCLIPASGFYEWAPAGPGKQPYFIRLKTDQIRREYGCHSVEYAVEVEGGQVKLKAKAGT